MLREIRPFIFQALAVALMAVLSPSSAFAFGDSCEALFKSPEEKMYDKFVGNWRFGSRAILAEILRKLEFNMISNLSMYEGIVDQAQMVDAATTFEVMRASKALLPTPLSQVANFRDAAPPPVGDEIRRALVEEKNEVVMGELLMATPYIRWLSENALPLKLRAEDKVGHGGFVVRPAAKPVRPVQLFELYRQEGMSAELAFYLMRKDLDPSLPAEAGELIERARIMFYAIRGFKTTVLPLFDPGDSAMNTKLLNQAWSLIPSRLEGRAALYGIINDYANQYRKVFPRAAYERLQLLKLKKSKYLAFFEIYKSEREKTTSQFKKFDSYLPALANLRDQLRLAREFPLQKLFEIAEVSFSTMNEGSYESVLLAVFREKIPTMNARFETGPEAAEVLEIVRRILYSLERLQTGASATEWAAELGQREMRSFELRRVGTQP